MWYRLCVDVDSTGNCVGASIEQHREDGTLERVLVNLQPGPFSDAAEIFRDLWTEVPHQLVLWPRDGHWDGPRSL